MEINRIYWGDSFELDKEIPDKSVDLILEDMPYGITACKWDVKIDLEKYWESRKRIIKDNGAIVLTANQPFTSELILSNKKCFKYEWIWEKSKATNFLFSKTMPLKAHENICIFYKRQPTYNPQKNNGKPYNKGVEKRNSIEALGKLGNGIKVINKTGKRNPRTIQYFRTAESEGKLNPTQKPVALFEYLIKTYTNEGDLVFDGFAGSGTTAVACLNTNRNFICIEKEQEYFDKSIERLEQQRQQFKLAV